MPATALLPEVAALLPEVAEAMAATATLQSQAPPTPVTAKSSGKAKKTANAEPWMLRKATIETPLFESKKAAYINKPDLALQKSTKACSTDELLPLVAAWLHKSPPGLRPGYLGTAVGIWAHFCLKYGIFMLSLEAIVDEKVSSNRVL